MIRSQKTVFNGCLLYLWHQLCLFLFSRSVIWDCNMMFTCQATQFPILWLKSIVLKSLLKYHRKRIWVHLNWIRKLKDVFAKPIKSDLFVGQPLSFPKWILKMGLRLKMSPGLNQIKVGIFYFFTFIATIYLFKMLVCASQRAIFESLMK